jgi:hypothetical protein
MIDGWTTEMRRGFGDLVRPLCEMMMTSHDSAAVRDDDDIAEAAGKKGAEPLFQFGQKY